MIYFNITLNSPCVCLGIVCHLCILMYAHHKKKKISHVTREGRQYIPDLQTYLNSGFFLFYFILFYFIFFFLCMHLKCCSRSHTLRLLTFHPDV